VNTKKHVSVLAGFADRPQALLGERVLDIDPERVGKREQFLDLGDRHAVLLALLQVAVVPVEAGDCSKA
jgi:hypothetical protein